MGPIVRPRTLRDVQADVERVVELAGWMIWRDRLKKQDGSLLPVAALQRLLTSWLEHPRHKAQEVSVRSLRSQLPADVVDTIGAGEGAFGLERTRSVRQTYEEQTSVADKAISEARQRLKELERAVQDEANRLRAEQQNGDRQVAVWANTKREAETAALAAQRVEPELAYCAGLKRATGLWAALTGRAKRIGQISLQVSEVVQQVRRALPDPPPLSLYFPRNGEGKCTGAFLSFPVDHEADLARLKKEIPGWLKDARTRLAARVEESSRQMEHWREVKRQAGRTIEERKQAAKRERQQLSEEEKKQTEQRDQTRRIADSLKRFEDEVPNHGFFAGKDIVAIAVLHDGTSASPQQTVFCCAGLTDDPIVLRSLDLGQRDLLPGHEGGVVGVAVATSGVWMASAGLDGEAKLWSTEPPALCRSVSVGSPAYSVTFGGDSLFVGTDERIEVYSLPELNPMGPLTDVEGMVWGLAFDWERQRLYAITASFEEPLGTAVYVWDIPTTGPSLQLRQRLRGFGGLGLSLACDPKGKWLAAGEGCGSPQAPEPSRVLVWDATTLRLKRVFICHNGWVEAVAFSPDGRWLVSGDATGPIGKPTPSTLFLHDVEANRTVLALGAHGGWVRSLAFNREGGMLFSGGSDGVWIWDFHGLKARFRE